MEIHYIPNYNTIKLLFHEDLDVAKMKQETSELALKYRNNLPYFPIKKPADKLFISLLQVT